MTILQTRSTKMPDHLLDVNVLVAHAMLALEHGMSLLTIDKGIPGAVQIRV